MSSPKILVQILATGTRILGKAFYEAGKQAVKNAKHSPQGASSDIAGMDNATTGSITDRLTREHRMTLDEARLILNVRRDDNVDQVLKSYEHLFKANSPPAEAGQTPVRNTTPAHSHYLQSKVVCARERIEAETKHSDTLAPTEARTDNSPN